MAKSKTLLTVTAIVVALGGVCTLACCGLLGFAYWSAIQPQALPYEEGNDLAAARSQFQTKLIRVGPAPQDYEDELPPNGVQLVDYPSGDLQLKGWLSKDPGDGVKRPAVVYLHGGWAFGGVDWTDASPFVDAGFVLMMPMLRGENGNPGYFEHVYGEVDDAIAAGEYVASLPYVDEDNLFIAGHSAGAMLAVLAAMVPSRYKAVSALSGVVDYEEFVASDWGDVMPYNPTNSEERRLRNPMAFVESLRCPVYIFVEQQNPYLYLLSQRFATKAKGLGKECQLSMVPGDHMTMVDPAVRRTIPLFRALVKPTP